MEQPSRKNTDWDDSLDLKLEKYKSQAEPKSNEIFGQEIVSIQTFP